MAEITTGTNSETLIGMIKEELKEYLSEAIQQAIHSGALAPFDYGDLNIEVPRDASNGDFSTNAAMLLAKSAKTAPQRIAQNIVDYFPQDTKLVQSVEIAGPGFINFYLKDGWLQDSLYKLLRQGDRFGRSNQGKKKKVQIEFVSANPTGELHIGNARGAAIGDTLASLMSLCGYDVKREFYINDAGNQIEKFGVSLECRYLQELGEDVPFPEDGYVGQDIILTMRQLIEEQGDKYKDMEPTLRRELLTQYALEKKISTIRKALCDFGVEYDVWFSEQSLHDGGAVADVIESLKEKNYLLEEDDALWLDCRLFGEAKPEVLVRANGVPTYYAADIAYHDNKFKRGFDQVIDIWGADHHGHVARMIGAMEALGYERGRLQVILMQFVRLYQDGELLKMSKRTGTYVTLEELVEEVGRDAARFFFVMRSSDSLIDFDLDLAKSQSAENPVYYVQYAHARICSILSAAKEQGYNLADLADDKIRLALLTDESEEALIRKMLDYPDEVIYAAVHREPHRIAAYIQDLAGAFHHFYNNCRVLGEEEPLSLARCALILGVKTIIKSALNAMGVQAPEKM